MAKKNETLTYASAYAELERILSDLQKEEIDLDEMTSSIKRARELITFCQTRLRNLENEVAEIFSEGDDED